MGEYKDAEELVDLYQKQREQQLTDLNKVIVALRTKVSILENTLEKERKEREKIPLPLSVVKQIVELETKNRMLIADLQFFLKHVPNQIIINRLKQDKKPTRRGGLKK